MARRTTRRFPRIAISLGDPSGVGPEVTAKALAALRGELAPLVFGDPRVFARDLAGVALPVVAPGAPLPSGGALVAVTRLPAAAVRPGRFVLSIGACSPASRSPSATPPASARR